MKKGDIILIASLLCLSLLIFVLTLLPDPVEPAEVVISVNGSEYARYPLDEDRVVVIENRGYVNRVEISGGRVRMLDADCPDGVCVGQGWLSDTGSVIVCLPARITITLSGESPSEVDAVAS